MFPIDPEKLQVPPVVLAGERQSSKQRSPLMSRVFFPGLGAGVGFFCLVWWFFFSVTKATVLLQMGVQTLIRDLKEANKEYMIG